MVLKLKKQPKKPEVVLISDPNADVDDTISFIVAAAMADKKLIHLRAVVATSGDYLLRLRRAKFAKGCWMNLGYPLLPVAAGNEYLMTENGPDQAYTEAPAVLELEKQGVNIIRDANAHLERLLKSAEEKSLTFVVNAEMADLARLLQNCGKNITKIARIIVMGGRTEKLDFHERILPDENSYNVSCCPGAAKSVFRLAQDNNIRLVLVPKEAVYQVQVQHDFYEKIAASAHPVAQAVIIEKREHLRRLWNDVCQGKYPHFVLHRFLRVFMGEDYKINAGEINGHMSFEEIEPKIRYYNLYDAVAILAAADKQLKEYFRVPRISEKYMVYQMQILDAEGLKKLLTEMVEAKLNPID